MAALTPGGAPMAACPLLDMVQLRELSFHQLSWSAADVEAMLLLQQCFQARVEALPQFSIVRGFAVLADCLALPLLLRDVGQSACMRCIAGEVGGGVTLAPCS